MAEASATIGVVCSCGKKLKAPASAAGRKAKCPKCGNVLTVVAPPPQEADDPFDALYDLAEQSEQAAAQQQSAPRCPGCMREMAAGAVLCTNCGFDTRSGKSIAATPALSRPAAAKGTRYDPAAAAAAAAVNAKKGKTQGVDKMAPQASYWRGLAGCVGGAAIGGIVWFLFAWGTGYELYFLVLVVAALAGVGMQWGQKGYSYLGGFTAAGVTLVTMILARLAVVVALVIPMMRASAASDAAEEAAMRMPDLSMYDQRVVNHVYGDEVEKLPPAASTGEEDDDNDAGESDEGIDGREIGRAVKAERKREAAAYQAVERKLKAMPKPQYAALVEKLRREERDASLEGLLIDEIIKKQYNVHPDRATAGMFQDASRSAEQRLAAMSEPQRDAEYKRLNELEEKEFERERAEVQAERAARKARGEDDGGSGAGAAVAVGGIVILFLMFGGIKGGIFTLLALGLAYRTASGSVSDS